MKSSDHRAIFKVLSQANDSEFREIVDRLKLSTLRELIRILRALAHKHVRKSKLLKLDPDNYKKARIIIKKNRAGVNRLLNAGKDKELRNILRTRGGFFPALIGTLIPSLLGLIMGGK